MNRAGLLSQLEKNLGYQFQNPSLVELALTHRSAGPRHNERLEFLGDAILGFTVAEELYRHFPDAPEGDLSRLRSSLVNKETLAVIAREIHLGQALILGPGELKSGGRQRESILANTLEALFGAIYLDGGTEPCRLRVLALLLPYMPVPGQHVNKDAKTRLQEVLQARGLDVPVYEVTAITGEAHEQVFAVKCHIPLLDQPTHGKGSNRRIAEQQAAGEALRLLGGQLSVTEEKVPKGSSPRGGQA